LDLPAELRNTVYTERLVNPTPIQVDKNSVPELHVITRVNRQIREEARKIYYLQNTFHFYPTQTYDLTAYRKLVGRADLDDGNFRKQIFTEVDPIGERPKQGVYVSWPGLESIRRQIYKQGGNWSTIVRGYLESHHLAERLVLLEKTADKCTTLIQKASGYKEEGLA